MTLALLTLLGALAGAAVGSYTGVAAERGWRRSVGGRSACAGCGTALRWWELVPVASWLVLRGRCARCGSRIPVSLLVREVAGAAAGAVAALLVAGR